MERSTCDSARSARSRRGGNEVGQQVTVADVALDEAVPRVVGDRVEVLPDTGVSQLVQHCHQAAGVVRVVPAQQAPHEVRADEPGRSVTSNFRIALTIHSTVVGAPRSSASPYTRRREGNRARRRDRFAPGPLPGV